MVKTVLVVDDSKTLRLLVARTLEEFSNVRVVQAVDGLDALERLGQERFELILTDINMPNMNGFELLEAIRINRGDTVTPIVVITTEGDQASAERALELGANAHLSKPLDALRVYPPLQIGFRKRDAGALRLEAAWSARTRTNYFDRRMRNHCRIVQPVEANPSPAPRKAIAFAVLFAGPLIGRQWFPSSSRNSR